MTMPRNAVSGLLRLQFSGKRATIRNMAQNQRTSIALSPHAEMIGRLVALHIDAGRYSLAHRVVEEIELGHRLHVAGGETLLVDTGLPVEIVEAMIQASIHTVSEVQDHTDKDLLAVRNMDPTRLALLRRATRPRPKVRKSQSGRPRLDHARA